VASFKLQKKSGRYPATPLNEGYFALSEKEPSTARTKEFQSLTSSLAFISCITRLDIAKAYSVLAHHLQNTSQKHLAATKHVWEYLISTQYYAICTTALRAESALYITDSEAIEAGVEPLFFGASDTAFADNLKTRRCLHSFMFKLYRMLINWKATVQCSVMSDMRQYWPKGIGVEKYMYIDPLALKGLEEGGLLSDPSRDAQNTDRHTMELPSEKDHPSLTAPASASLIAHCTGLCQPDCSLHRPLPA
jgi:hypothetical protein